MKIMNKELKSSQKELQRTVILVYYQLNWFNLPDFFKKNSMFYLRQ